ncbi:MAG: hydrogenase/urease maturation nickel metallochaperone HypA [Candidatus Kariarchaeaceae archaeon]
MHDKTLILPIIEDLEHLLLRDVVIELKIGNFTNLDEQMITTYLHSVNPIIFSEQNLRKITFSSLQGEVQCFNCDFVGHTNTVIKDHALHLNAIVACPKCDSLQTKKISGNQLIVEVVKKG